MISSSPPKDGGKAPIDLNTYQADIASARDRGAIVSLADRATDEFSPVNAGLTTENTRGLSDTGSRLFESVLARDNGNRIGPLRVLVLGHGAGRECAQITALAREHKRAVVVDALGLSEISPSISLTRSANDIAILIERYGQEHGDISSERQRSSRAVSLAAAFDIQNKGYDIFEILDEPFIRTQFIGLFRTAVIEQRYDFIYDNFGPFWYSTKDHGLQETLSKVSDLLSDQGVFYAENLPAAARGALGAFPDKKVNTITSGFLGRFIAYKRGNWFEQAVAGSLNISVDEVSGHKVISFGELFAPQGSAASDKDVLSRQRDGGVKSPGGIDLRRLSPDGPAAPGFNAGRQESGRDKDEQLLAIARILRNEEDTGVPASPACKELLLLLESGV
jgi:hypothetical protein